MPGQAPNANPSSSPSSRRKTLVEQIGFHEGFRTFIYDDRTGERIQPGSRVVGTPTFGYGFTHIPQRIADLVLVELVGELHTTLANKFGWFSRLSDPRQRVVVDMAYNLGLGGLLKFQRFLAAIEEQNWACAAEEMLQSRWAGQVGRRAVTLAKMMRHNLTFEEATK